MSTISAHAGAPHCSYINSLQCVLTLYSIRVLISNTCSLVINIPRLASQMSHQRDTALLSNVSKGNLVNMLHNISTLTIYIIIYSRLSTEHTSQYLFKMPGVKIIWRHLSVSSNLDAGHLLIFFPNIAIYYYYYYMLCSQIELQVMDNIHHMPQDVLHLES